jgi:hypothetical protein
MLTLSLEGGSVHLSNTVVLSMVVCLATSAIQAYLLAVLAKKGLRKILPVFFAYNAAYAATNVVLTVADAIVGPTQASYFYLYWVLNTLLMLLEFGIMYEVFVHAVKPYSGLIDLAKMLFKWAALFLLLASALTAISTTGSHFATCMVATTYLDRGLRMMQCGLLILFFLFERRLGLSWRSHSVCVALGLGTMSATGLTFAYLRTQLPLWDNAFEFSNNLIYLSMVMLWVGCFRLPQPERKNVLDSPARLIFQRWNEALVATPFVSGGGAAIAQMDSFLPNVERTVERVLARKMVN